MKIWASNDRELRFTEIDDDLVAVNVFTSEYVIGVMLNRRECEALCLGLAEWCGIPLFMNQSDDSEE
jgi:hypothetical protein